MPLVGKVGVLITQLLLTRTKRERKCEKKNFSKHKINVRTDSKVFLVLFFYLHGTLLLFHVFRFLSLFTSAEDIKAKRAAGMDVNLSSSVICREKKIHARTHPTAVMDWECEN